MTQKKSPTEESQQAKNSPIASQYKEQSETTKQYRSRHNSDTERKNLRRSNRKATVWLCICVLAMFGFGFALVPLYDVMCDVLGINGKTNSEAIIEPSSMQIDTTRTVRVEFMTHIKPDMPWQFKPQTISMNVHPGEVVKTAYVAFNPSTQDTVGQAVPSVAPSNGASYFNKIECFCFNKQPLTAGGRAEMPVIFYIEPDLPASISTLTLSYTLFNITPKEDEKSRTTANTMPALKPDGERQTHDNRGLTSLAFLWMPDQQNISKEILYE